MTPWKLAAAAAVAALVFVAPACHRPTAAKDTASAPTRTPDVIFVPTPEPVVEEMMELADVKPGDVVYDLGCGDGRIAIAAAKRGAAKSVCVDIDPARIAEARANAKEEGVEDKVTIIQGDLFQLDFSDADVVTLYLLPDLNLKLRPKLLALRPGTRIVSHAFDMGDWKPEVERVVDGKTVYAWTVPANGRRAQARTPPAPPSR
jgi:SAM-dependent methyltransferase